MSKPWLPAYQSPAVSTMPRTSSTSRPLITPTTVCSASRASTARMSSSSTASSGRATIGVSVPS